MEQLLGKTEQEITSLHNIYRVLGNKGRLKVYLYLQKAKVATCCIIAKRLGMNRSVVYKYTKELVAVGLVLREKWFTATVYKINPTVLVSCLEGLAA